MGKQSLPNWKDNLIRICRILKDNGIDIQKIPIRKTLENGKREYITLKDIEQEGINITKIIKENGLDESFAIGKYIRLYRNAYNGTKGALTLEEGEAGEMLEIVVKRNESVTPPIFKGRKLSAFHLNYISGILDEILSGQINTKEALELLRKASIENGEMIIEDSGSIKRCVEMLLKDRPEDLKLYYETLKKNIHSRTLLAKRKPSIGIYHKEEKEFKKKIIEYYLPLILNGQITFDMIEKELSSSHQTINKIIEEFYTKNGDLKGLEKYRNSKKSNKGSIEQRENAKRAREEVANYQLVTNKEFILLSPEQQEMQLIMKIRTEKLKEELSKTNRKKSVLSGEDFIKAKIKMLMDYFRSKNNPNSGKEFFSDEDIRYMIFKYPSLIGRTVETLERKIDILTSYAEIDEETAYGMIKTFPAIIGYDASRTKAQLDLLEQEDLIDAVIASPKRFMQSVELMYALIQYAKERHHTTDLTNINRSNIFMNSSSLKRLYGVSYDDIKARYPYIAEDEKTQNAKHIIHPIEIGIATFDARSKSEEASRVLNEAIQNNEKEQR